MAVVLGCACLSPELAFYQGKERSVESPGDLNISVRGGGVIKLLRVVEGEG